jgi:ABC-2 type transport system ATP-binding protein
MAILQVHGLNKSYENFSLKDVSFELQPGYIMGFIGANGAGKTTTLKSMLNMISVKSGSVSVFEKDFYKNELSLKQEIGVMFGGVDYYPNTKISKVTNVIKRFYNQWDDDIYYDYLKRFNLDENKKVKQLSDGMKVKYSLAIALSHHSKLFILDEPTSGLDPVARDEILAIFQALIEDGQKSILFSTHITSDLEKCADYITYISNGRIIASKTKDDLLESYRMIKGPNDGLDKVKNSLIAYKTNAFGFSGLIETNKVPKTHPFDISFPSIEDIMIYYAKKENNDEESVI